MTFHLYRAERTDTLADALADVLAVPLDSADPFETELVIVAAAGTERWLGQHLSHRLGASPGCDDGVCAGVRFVRPQSIVAELLGIDDDDPWRPDALVWPILEEIEAGLNEPWCATLARHLGEDRTGVERELRRDRRLSVARHVAHLFHEYARQRPALTAAWTAGRDEDGTGAELPAELAWQATLWRRVRVRIGGPAPDERQATTIRTLLDDPGSIDLPERISLFGHTRIPLGELQVLAALARHRDLHVWLPHPSDDLWQRLAAGSSTVIARSDDRSAEVVNNPLQAALGRDLRELQRSLAMVAPDAVTHVLSGRPRPDTLLGRLQRDLIADQPGAADPELGADRSIQVHACHGQARQVDVLRDVVIGLLEDDPTLEPRDIVVMVPDVETYAPLFQAAFGLGEAAGASGHPGHRLQVMLADRAATGTNPLLALVVDLLEVARSGRYTTTEILDVLSAGPVRHRFDLDDDALERVSQWVEASGVRWGLDGEHRRRFGLTLEQNTWQAGIDRLIAGAVAAEDALRPVGGVQPLDDVSSSDLDLVGQLVTAVDALAGIFSRFGSARTMAQWSREISQGLSALASVPQDDAWQWHQLERELEQLDDDGAALRPGEVLAHLRDRWSGRPGRVGFRTGMLTVCTMVPMRSVPHRVVCLVGLDDGVFPRSPHRSGDDVLAHRPLTGERDPRAEDRQLLLDAVMSATETLVVTYSGADEHRGQPRPPAVPLGELLDQVHRTASSASVVTHHPLQPFDPRNLRPGALVNDGRPFSFDPAALAGARAGLQASRSDAAFLPNPLDPVHAPELTLTDLEWFVQNPVKAFWRQRLGVSLPGDQDVLAEDLPIDLSGLGLWKVGQRLLDEALRGVRYDDAWEAIRRSGLVPPGELGRVVSHQVDPRVGALITGTADLRADEARSVDIDLDLPDGRRLTGTVEGVHGSRVVTVTYSTIRAKQRIRDWVRLLVLTAHDPDTAWAVHTAGKINRGTAQLVTGPLAAPHEALVWLADLVALADLGLTRPLPLPPQLSYDHATKSRRLAPDAAARLAASEWAREAGFNAPPPERDAEEIVRVWGPNAPFSVLADAGFATLSTRLWHGALDHQREVAL